MRPPYSGLKKNTRSFLKRRENSGRRECGLDSRCGFASVRHSVSWVSKENPAIDDFEVLAIGLDRTALLITEDKGFGEKVFRDRLISAGVLLLRVHDRTFEERAAIVS